MMTTLFLYSIKSAFVLALLYVPYTLMLRKESFFRLNRFTLLTILGLSLLLPLCNFPSLAEEEQPVTHAVNQQVVAWEKPVEQQTRTTTPVPPSVREKVTPAASHHFAWSWYSVLCILCIVGMFSALLFRLWQFVRMGFLMRRGCLWKDRVDGFIIYCHSDDIAPCSWMNRIVISQRDYSEHRHEILLHEKGHILHHHSLDILLLTFVQVVQWWNPFVYLLGTSLRDVHEYEADHHVLQQGVRLSQYQNLLIRKAIDTSSISLANGFSHSLVRRRIAMMHKTSNPWMQMKVLYILPLIIVALSAFATPAMKKPVEESFSSLEYRFINMEAIQSLHQNNKQSLHYINEEL